MPTFKQPRSIALLIGAIAATAYWLTAYPSIDWWDSSDYSLAAVTLGITGAPGSLVLVLMGWPVAHLFPGDSPAHRLNLLAGAIGAATAALVFIAALSLDEAASRDAERRRGLALWGLAAGALVFAFSPTPWEYSVAFNPYILTALVTAVMLIVLAQWWRRADDDGAWRLLVLLAFLLGLDFSVHRTNSLLIPAALPWILLRKPRALANARIWLASIGALVLGVSLQLVWIPIAHVSKSPLNWDAPLNLREWWSYVSLEGLGGAFLLGVFPRKSGFLTAQTADLLRVLGNNLLGWAIPAAVAGVVGIIALFRRDRRLGMAFVALLLLQATLTVVYFNIPANFFRTMDRHYLPVLVTAAVAIALGLQVLVSAAFARERRAGVVALVVAALVPVLIGASNWRDADASNRHFAYDYARNLLKALPANAIHFTVGDNDTFPLMYVQSAEGYRTDVDVVNYSVAALEQFSDYARRVRPTVPVRMSTADRRAFNKAPPEQMPITLWRGLEPVNAGSLSGQGSMTLSDRTMVDILVANDWKRPVTIATTAGGVGWLSAFARNDGLFWRVLPEMVQQPDATNLRTLLTANEFRGFADPGVRIVGPTRNFGYNYWLGFATLLAAEKSDTAQCRVDRRRANELVPLDRLDIPESALPPLPCG